MHTISSLAAESLERRSSFSRCNLCIFWATSSGESRMISFTLTIVLTYLALEPKFSVSLDS